MFETIEKEFSTLQEKKSRLIFDYYNALRKLQNRMLEANLDSQLAAQLPTSILTFKQGGYGEGFKFYENIICKQIEYYEACIISLDKAKQWGKMDYEEKDQNGYITNKKPWQPGWLEEIDQNDKGINDF